MHHRQVSVGKKEREETVLRDFCLCLIGQSCVMWPLKEGLEIKCLAFYILCHRDRQGRRVWEMEFVCPNIHCLPLPRSLMAVTNFNLPVLSILRVTFSFLGGCLVNKSMSKRSPKLKKNFLIEV